MIWLVTVYLMSVIITGGLIAVGTRGQWKRSTHPDVLAIIVILVLVPIVNTYTGLTMIYHLGRSLWRDFQCSRS